MGAETEGGQCVRHGAAAQGVPDGGLQSVDFEMEPVAAAYFYQSTLDHEELILIGDFGGAPAISLLRVGPKVRTAEDFLGNSGVGLAGDAFDAKIVRNLVSPRLGAGSMARAHEKVLPAVPNWVYAKLERWHHLSFLRTRAVLNMLHSTKAQAFEPEQIAALIHLLEEHLGYHLHAAVQRTKCRLSEAEDAEFHFVDGALEIRAAVLRADF